MPAPAEPARGALDGIRVVDLTRILAGPFCTLLLADMGAEVIKIEACNHPDWWRGWEHTTDALRSREHEKSPSFNQINRNKLGVAIDLTRPAGRELALKLVARADARLNLRHVDYPVFYDGQLTT